MPSIKPAARPPSTAQIATATLERVSAGGRFGKAVELSSAQLNAFGKKLETLAKSNPERAAKLLQRTLDLYGEGKIKVKSDGPLSHAGHNAIAQMSAKVSAVIQRADPDVMTPAPMVLAR